MGNAQEYYFNRVACFIQDAYVGLHYKWTSKDGQRSTIPGVACQDTRTLINQAQYWCHDRSKDVWVSMGAQKENLGLQFRTSHLPTALRKTHNTIAAKCFYIDVDVDLDPKKDAYRSREEMDEAINKFVSDAVLPPPNLVINSGRGGKHLYWILDAAIHPDDFNPVARALANAVIALGLKADSQCTSDICRLLRPPGTFNYKDPKRPLPVTIDSRIEEDYTYDAISGPLAGYTNRDRSSTKISRATADDDPELADNLEGGIADPVYAPADIEVVAKECPFIRNTLITGGRDHSQPLWFLTLGLACHTTDPDAVAAQVSNGYPNYSAKETANKLAILQRDRQS